MRKLIIDCDPGIDDALALFLAAAAPDCFHLLAVTCVAGNRPTETTAANACRLLDAAGCSHVPVFAGAERPLDGSDARCNLVHGEDGLGGVLLPTRRAPEAESAVDYLVRTLLASPPQSITLVAIGPLTNLALAELKHPGILRRLQALLLMGGAVACPGNIAPGAEFNFYADPDAAKLVLESCPGAHLFGLDVTSKALMSDKWIDSLADLDGECARLSHQMLIAYASLDPLLHDACPIAFLMRPELFTGDSWSLTVDTTPGPNAGGVSGAPLAACRRDAERPDRPHVQVYFDVDAEGLLNLVRTRLTRLP